MFNIFSRKKINEWEVRMLKSVFENLPDKFQIYLDQLNANLLIGVREYPKLKYIGFKYNSDIVQNYESKSIGEIILKGIIVENLKSRKEVELNIHLAFGLIIGYSTSVEIGNFMPDLSKISLNKLSIEEVYSLPKNLLDLLNEEEINMLKKFDVYEVEIGTLTLYHLFDLDDGDFVCFDNSKRIFKVNHSDNKISNINDDLLSFLKNK